MNVKKASQMGMCLGVKLALDKALNCLNNNKDKDIYLLGSLVHNDELMDSLKEKGLKILPSDNLKESLDTIKDGIAIFSAHGHNDKFNEYARSINVNYIDATCPKVKLVIDKVKFHLENSTEIIYIGIEGHDEAKAILSLIKEIIFIDYLKRNYPKRRIINPIVFAQTTLEKNKLNEIINEISLLYENPTFYLDICSATTSRQNAIKEIDSSIYYIVVIGYKNSSNTRRLYESCLYNHIDKKVLFVSNLEELKTYKFDNDKNVFITAGTSTPSFVIDPIIDYLKSL